MAKRKDPTPASSEDAEIELAPEAGSELNIKVRKRAFNGLSPQEWTRLSRNVWSDLSSPRHKRHLEHGAVFPLKLASRLISMYSGEGDLVFEPFAGVGTTLVAAYQMNRRSVGIELNPAFVAMAREWLSEEHSLLTYDEYKPNLVNDDCRNLSQHLDANSVQVTVTSPPYADFIHRSVADRAKTHKTSRIVKDNNSRVKAYSNDERDFGNLAYDNFLQQSKDLFAELLKVTRPDGYAVWVVKDYRLPPHRPYISMHSDLARMAEEVGWLWHDLIVWDQNEQRRLVLLGYPTRFYTNQNCSFLVILRKPSNA